MSLPEARRNRHAIEWNGYSPPTPAFAGTRAFKDYDLSELVPYIDWTPFFKTWDLAGLYPRIFKRRGGG